MLSLRQMARYLPLLVLLVYVAVFRNDFAKVITPVRHVFSVIRNYSWWRDELSFTIPASLPIGVGEALRWRQEIPISDYRLSPKLNGIYWFSMYFRMAMIPSAPKTYDVPTELIFILPPEWNDYQNCRLLKQGVEVSLVACN
ncbi:MAG: hypothetical protein KIH69_009120 [Anaerolineae bacterium]|nr:hypothetical protein [Anaerolineae bacterium]